MDEVRKSIIRISFSWKCRRIVDPISRQVLVRSAFKPVVIPGVIVSIDDKSIIIIVDGTFFSKFRKEEIKNVKVQFPNPKGGYQARGVEHKIFHAASMDDYICVFEVKPGEVNDEVMSYLQPIKLETRMAARGHLVRTFVFPTESAVTPTAYCPGSVIYAHKELLLHGCHVHEYAHFGSPLFNESNNLIGICCGSQGQTQSWSVAYLRRYFSESPNCRRLIGEVSYLLDGSPISMGEV